MSVWSVVRERRELALPAIFLVFLIPQVVNVWASHDAWWVRVVGVGLVIGFAVVYMWGFYRFPMPVFGPPERSVWWVFVVLTALTGGLSVLVGPVALATLPFHVAAACYLLRRPVAVVVAMFYVLGVVAVLRGLGVWDELSFIPWLVAGVFAGNFVLASVFIGDARTMQVEQELAVTRERERLARDVHDSLGHTLTVVSIKAELASRLVSSQPERAARELVEVRDHVRDALSQVRDVVTGLTHHSIADHVSALRYSMDGAGLDVEVTGSMQGVPQRVVESVGWIVREAGTNVLRHARASRCTIAVTSRDLTITDNGVGIPAHFTGVLTSPVAAGSDTMSANMRGPGPQLPGRHGITSMTQRAADAGLTLTITVPAGGGTTLTVGWDIP